MKITRRPPAKPELLGLKLYRLHHPMPKSEYRSCKFAPPTLALIERCKRIIAEYTAQGFQLTLRQLFYQLVARGFH